MTQELVERLRRQDASALTELFDLVAPRALALARRVLRDPASAEDAVQEAFAQIWEMAPRLRLEGRIESMVMTMVYRRAIDIVRRRRTTTLSDAAVETLATVDERASAAFDDVVQALSEETLKARLRLVLAALPDDQRLVVQRVYFDSLTLREIAEREEIPLGTVKSRLRLAMTKLSFALRAEVRP